MAAISLNETTDNAVLARLLALDGLDLVDVGCGAGRLCRWLAEQGATVTGVEPDPLQAAKNRDAPGSGVTFVEAPGDSIPVDSASVDGVFFSRSLHHVPPPLMDSTLAEARRLLKPGGGFLCIIEPGLEGSFHEFSRLFNDESEARRMAITALERIAPSFTDLAEYRYQLGVSFADFETFLDGQRAVTFRETYMARIDTPEVREKFATGRAEGAYEFTQVMRLWLYREARAPALTRP